MPAGSDEKPRKRLVVEEVSTPASHETEENPVTEAVTGQPINEVKEKVEELQTITEHMGSDIKESENIQEDLARAVEEVKPSQTTAGEKTEEPFDQSKPASPLWIIVPGIFLLGALLGGIVFYQKFINKSANETPSPSPTGEITSSTPAPSDVPISQVNLANYPVQIQNGSGIPGEASNVSNILTAAGFSVSGTGNANSYDFTKTIIQAKSDVPASFITKLSDALSKTYVVDKPQSLPDSSTDKVVIIVGSSKN